MNIGDNNTTLFIERFEFFMQAYLNLLSSDYTYAKANARLKGLLSEPRRFELKRYSKLLIELNKYYYLLKPNCDKKSQLVIPSDFAIQLINKCINEAENPTPIPATPLKPSSGVASSKQSRLYPSSGIKRIIRSSEPQHYPRKRKTEISYKPDIIVSPDYGSGYRRYGPRTPSRYMSSRERREL